MQSGKANIILVTIIAVAVATVSYLQWQSSGTAPAGESRQEQSPLAQTAPASDTAPQTETTDTGSVSDPDREARRQARKQARAANSEAGDDEKLNRQRNRDDETPEERQARKQEEREATLNKRLSNKSWWNKKGKNKLEDAEFSEEVLQQMDNRVDALLDTRQTLGMELLQLRADNYQSLASGNLAVINANLERIDQLQDDWRAARREAVSDILGLMTAEQLAAVAEAGGDIADLNWFDYELDKGLESPRDKPEKKRRQNTSGRNGNG